MADIFITENFLLESKTAIELYHAYARDLPIIDYHCHLPPAQIAEDHQFRNLTEIWLEGDHYKWRAMRANGVDERYCTGEATDWEKFEKWAGTVPKTLRNPLYHWTHMELKRPFGISDRLLNPQTARGIWEECNAKLSQKDFSSRGIMRQMNVALVCTTDDPTDDLRHHAALADDSSFPIRVIPAFRPDRAMMVESARDFNAWTDRLAEVSKVDIRNFNAFLEALRKRHEFFHQMRCRLSDHGIEQPYAEEYAGKEIESIFEIIRGGGELNKSQILKFKSAMLYEFGLMDFERGWTQQFHLGALRNVNSRAFEQLGPDKGFDTIGDFELARPLARFLDRLDRTGQLAKTILYNLNPRDNELMGAMTGNFQDGRIPGKIQFGSAWWFLDQRDGMLAQLKSLSNMGLLSLFVGMITDSRSFLSYTRHEYFRRILCNLLGGEMEAGLLPREMELAGEMVKDICFRNAANMIFGGAVEGIQ